MSLFITNEGPSCLFVLKKFYRHNKTILCWLVSSEFILRPNGAGGVQGTSPFKVDPFNEPDPKIEFERL